MRSLRKRKADELSATKPVLKKFRSKRSNEDVELIESYNSVKINQFLREFEIVLDKSVVSQYFHTKDFPKDSLRLHTRVQGTCRNEKYKGHTNNIERIAVVNGVKNHKNYRGIPEICEDIAVKVEPDADINNISHVNDSSLIKQELPDEMVEMESPGISETDRLTESTELHVDGSIIKNEDGLLHKIESIDEAETTDATLKFDSCNDIVDDDMTVDEEFKPEDFNVDCRISNNERESETNCENQENCSSSTSMSQVAEKSRTNEFNYYSCCNCDYKTTSKTVIKRHIFHNHMDKDGYLTCKKCNKKFRTDGLLNFHKKICGTKLYYTCKFCPKIVTSRMVMKRHIVNLHLDEFKMEELDGIMEEINMAKVRKNANKMAKVLKKNLVKERRVRSIFDRNKFIKMFCSKCNVISERGRAVVRMDCSTCGTTLLFQCQMCKKSYNNISSIRSHVKWSCESAETKMMKNNTVLSDLVLEKKIIVHTKLNPLLDEKNQPLEDEQNNRECRGCKRKNFDVCKHIEYKRVGCKYVKGLAVCPKCNSKFKMLKRCMEHQILCGVQFRFACPFCHYTSRYEDVRRHINSIHIGKIDVEKLQDIMDEVRNERNKVKDKYEADYRSSKLFKAIQSSDS